LPLIESGRRRREGSRKVCLTKPRRPSRQCRFRSRSCQLPRIGGLKMPRSIPYDRPRGDLGMLKRLAIILGVIAVGLALGGCTKCGPIWDDWLNSPKSCRS
jgi:hypothetical protein